MDVFQINILPNAWWLKSKSTFNEDHSFIIFTKGLFLQDEICSPYIQLSKENLQINK